MATIQIIKTKKAQTKLMGWTFLFTVVLNTS